MNETSNTVYYCLDKTFGAIRNTEISKKMLFLREEMKISRNSGSKLGKSIFRKYVPRKFLTENLCPKGTKKDKKYRTYRPETPSDPGGVSQLARDKIKMRRERDRDKGIYAESESRKKRDSGRDHRRDYRDKRDRSRDDRSERKRPRGDESSRRYEEWEDTPSSRHTSDGWKTTPRMRYGEYCV